ncbi:phosphoenolpyruvate--protein phosphotransferase [Arcobacter arenosus]|uniref:phosphoenolpyruvate--protein phosphotransferase n=1 Tax=Arcobacter arenosus TaxID=2576037 RepID=A0A5R8Y0J8_9BACT|nr:phosphoenolpyruvate--protein phosphotransferase [Arcobacter arenosus]TLP38296.1 phosphoenolpyruvate--protein phosphotransferase [Arcobacter arenosus]
MLKLEKNMVKLGSNIDSKKKAIEEVGKLLVDGGYIKTAYIDSIFGREEISNTYLGNGICIPHGLQENRNLILKTGIAVLQIPNGVIWKDDEKAHIIVGIAAKSDEHIEILSQLTNLLMDEEEAKKLATTKDINLILNTLNSNEKKEDNEVVEYFETKKEVIFPGTVGFHARPASLFVEEANKYNCEVQIEFNKKVANGKSVASILKLGITGKSTFAIATKGNDEDKALKALVNLVNSGMGEETSEEVKMEISKREYQGEKIEGIPAAPGMAIGPVVVLNEDTIEIKKEGKTSHEERKKLRNALDKAAHDLNQWLHKKHETVDKNRMDIFIAHLALIKDPELQNKALNSIVDGVSAEYTWWEIIKDEMKALSSLNDLRLSQRANDIKDIGKRVLRYLDENAIKSTKVDIKEPSILISLDMTPSETSKLDKQKVLAIVTAKGGSTSHTAILARSMGIPSIAGAGEGVLNINSKNAIADGDSGILVINPTKNDLDLAKKIREQEDIKKEKEFSKRFAPAVTTDKHRMEVVANIANADGALEAVNNGAEGVGLLRTEFLFLERDSAPNETEQFQAYKKMVQHLNGLPLIIRTLDIGGDKEVSYLNMPKEDNPFLGIRGIRLCLEYKDLFKEQLRAIYQASKYGPIKIMFPMVGLLEEFREASKIAEEVRVEVGASKIDIGMMIEVPSAVLMAEHFIKEADFFSIGTNDLTQYVLSMDRGHQGLAKKADALHPAVLKMIKMTCDAAKKENKWVGVCGNLAANPLAAKILTGLGVKELSVTASSIANIKSEIRKTSLKECEELALKALSLQTSDEVRSLEE